MIVQACLNGSRDASFHPGVPTTPAAIVTDAVAAVAAGAGELHIHIRDDDGRETLEPAVVDRTIAALRDACPGTLIGISTGQWIERDDVRRRECLRRLSVLPDYASVNFIEPDCAAVVDILGERGIGLEAGIWTAADARRCRALGLASVALRLLLEINHQAGPAALAELNAIDGELREFPVRKPVLLHGVDATLWTLVDLAFDRRYSTRIGLEDGRLLPDGSMAESNAALVAAAVDRRKVAFELAASRKGAS
jgi:uncharacterized protein (DUF849 family)